MTVPAAPRADELAHWQPHVLLACARALSAASDMLSAVARRLATMLRAAPAGVTAPAWQRPAGLATPGTVPAHTWHGPAAGRARTELSVHGQALTSVAAALSVAEAGLARGAPRLEEARTDAARAGPPLPWLLAPLALAVPVPLPFAVPGAAVAVTAEAMLGRVRPDSAAAAAAAAALAVTSALDEAERRCRGVLSSNHVDGTRAQARAALGAHGLRDWLDRPPGGSDPAVAASWWAAHSPAEQRALVADPVLGPSVGGLDGVPATARDRANRAALARRLAFGGSAEDRQVLEQLFPGAAPVDPVTGRRVVPLLLDYRPGSGADHGRVALAYGDPGTARHVAVVVPGLGTSVDPDLPALVSDTTALWRTTRRLAGAPDVAVVAWLGYDTPGLGQVALDGRARSGAEALARTVDGLLAARAVDPPHLTVVGHSYGSLVAGLAVRGCPGSVDDLVVLGSPGIEAGRAGDLPLGSGAVWVGAASGDPVSRLSRFGVDPAAAEFGGQRFQAETRRDVPEHSHYFDEGSESIRALAAIVAGRRDQVVRAAPRTDHGYAGELVQPLLPPPWGPDPDPARDDPEWSRRPHP